MKDPYRTLYFWAGFNNWQRDKWKYNMKQKNNVFYIGTDDDHITIMENTSGFHHSHNDNGKHIQEKQHLTQTTLLQIKNHVNFNKKFYTESDKIIAALEYIINHPIAK